MAPGVVVVVWGVSSPVAMAYVYYGVMRLPRGLPRLGASLPLVAFYMHAGHGFATVLERGVYSFFFIWLTSCKLALLCWDQGPVADPWPMASFPRFLAVMNLSLHIKRQKFAHRTSTSTSSGRAVVVARDQSTTRRHCNGEHSTRGGSRTVVVVMRLVFKFVFLGLIIRSYRYRDVMHVGVVSVVYSFEIYVACSLIFEGIAAVVSPMVGIELEAAFDKPFLAHSLADFWGRRWNLLVSNLLRVSVYDPVVRLVWSGADLSCGSVKLPLWPRSVATFACFLVSGLMHELIFYNMTRRKPTWEVTFFFVLNGCATILEGALGQMTRLRLPKLVSVPLTVSFVLVTAIWYFYPPLVDSGTVDDSIAEFTYFFQRLHELVGGIITQ